MVFLSLCKRSLCQNNTVTVTRYNLKMAAIPKFISFCDTNIIPPVYSQYSFVGVKVLLNILWVQKLILHLIPAHFQGFIMMVSDLVPQSMTSVLTFI